MGRRTRPSASFVGTRLRLARIFRGITQSELADRVELSQTYIHHLEAGSRQQPTSIVVRALSEVLGVPEAFFFEEPPRVEFRDEECAFRRRASTTLSQRLRVLAHGTLFAEAVSLVEEYVELPSTMLPVRRVASFQDIELLAADCRRMWGIPIDAPIANITRVLENAGIIVTRFAASASSIDAFSWASERNIIVLNTDKGSSSRARYDAAHEAAHLIMHRGMETGASDREDEANYFAGALLLPTAGFAREFGRPQRIPWDHVFQLKLRWRVSAAAIVRRAYDLRLISASEYRRANIYLRQNFFPSEPAEPPEEVPELFGVALQELSQGRGLDGYELANELGWSVELFETVTGFAAAPPAPGLPGIVSLESRRRRSGQ